MTFLGLFLFGVKMMFMGSIIILGAITAMAVMSIVIHAVGYFVYVLYLRWTRSV